MLALLLALQASTSQVEGLVTNFSVGGSVVVSSAETKVTPIARIAADFPTANNEYAPRVFVQADLSALPGQTIQFTNIETFKALEFQVGLAQKLPGTVIKFFGSVGFTTRLEGDTEPRERSPKFGNFGVLFVTKNRESHLAVGMGPDQRLSNDGSWRPTIQVDAAVAMYTKDKVKVSLVSSAILGLTSGIHQGERADVVRVGLTVGI